MPKNAVLLHRIKKLLRKARRLARESSQTADLYGECRYAARSWGKKRRVIVKAEGVQHPGREPQENPRFVVTNLAQTPKWIYEHVYCERGDAENRIKELKLGLEIDRTSCSSFWANQLRVLLTAAAYVLMQELRLRAARTSCARAQVQTLRERLIKVGAHVVESVRRVVLHLPVSYPFLQAWPAVPQSVHAPVSHPRSSNRTCGFPASGSPAGFTRRLTAEPPGAPFEAAGPPVRRRSCGHRSGVCPAWAPCGDAGESGVRVRGRSYPQPDRREDESRS